ncbi:MAG TPA: hypothetical protein VLN57_21220 [Xanthobacteraceae bacterium]|nr:hypothetical protein [Xanthobacteraceae bacterium]
MTNASGLPQAEQNAQTARFYGADIWLDISRPDATGQAQYIVTPAGDLQLATGREALRQSLLRRTLTDPGEWQTAPDFGVGARQFVKGRNTDTERTALINRVRSQYLRDPRVQSVDLVLVTPLDDGSPGVLLQAQVTPKGQLGVQPLPVHLEIR